MHPGHVFSAHDLARQLALDETQVGIWLDVLAQECVVIPEHGIESEAADGATHINYRVPID